MSLWCGVRLQAPIFSQFVDREKKSGCMKIASSPIFVWAFFLHFTRRTAKINRNYYKSSVVSGC